MAEDKIAIADLKKQKIKEYSNKGDSHSSFSFEAKEADEDLQMNIDMNQINNAVALDAKYELRGSMGSFKGNEIINNSKSIVPHLNLNQIKVQTVKIDNNDQNQSMSKRTRIKQQQSENPKMIKILEDSMIRADSTEFILSSKGLDAIDEGVAEQFASIANRQTVKNKSTMFEKRVNQIPYLNMANDLRSSQTATFV